MSFMHKLTLFFAGFAFRTTLFLGLSLLAAVLVLGNPETIKQSLVQANAYERYAQAIIDSGKSQLKSDPNAIPLDNPRIEAIIKKSLEEKFLQNISERGIDAVYNWLEGETPTIEFKVDVSKNRQLLADGVANYAVERLGSLPPCDTVPAETNVFRITCLPLNTNTAQIKQQVRQAILKDTSIFSTSTLTADNLPSAENGEKFLEAYRSGPKYFRLFVLAPWLLLGVAVVSALLMVFLNRTRRRGLHSVATSLIGTGIILAVAPLVYTYVLPRLGFSLPGSSTDVASETTAVIISDATKHLYSSFNTMLINIAIQIAVVGAVLFIVSRLIGRRSSPYASVKAKAGVAVVGEKPRAGGPKVASTNVPLQTSERPPKSKRKASALEKKFRRL